MLNYNTLHLETLEIILEMHVKHQVQLLADPQVKHQRLLRLERTIADVKNAISTKEAVPVFNGMAT